MLALKAGPHGPQLGLVSKGADAAQNPNKQTAQVYYRIMYKKNLVIFRFGCILFHFQILNSSLYSMEKSLSVASFTSDQLDDEENEDSEFEYNAAPWDVLGGHESVGTIVVAKKGEKLPLETKYKRRKLTDVAVKFYVSKSLQVVSVEKSKTLQNVKVVTNQHPVVVTNQHPVDPVQDQNILASNIPAAAVESAAEDIPVEQPNDIFTAEGFEEEVSKRRYVGESEFLVDLDINFEKVIIEGLEAGLRKPVREKMTSNKVLLAKENNAVINSLNLVISNQFGKEERPNAKFRAKLAEILKSKFPATYRVQNAVRSSFGALALPRSRGEGGGGDLAKRIGNCFYNQIIRPGMKRPIKDDEIQAPARGKKKKKSFGVNAGKMKVFETASKAEKKDAEDAFKKMEESDLLEVKKKFLQEARVFIQKQFQTVEPSQLVEDFKGFWDGGPALLSEHFEWLSDGSKDGSLAISVAGQLAKVLSIVERFILNKRGDAFGEEMDRVKAEAEEKNGSNLMYQIFLLRNLARLFKNKPQKVLFIDGEDCKESGPNETQPNIFVTKKHVVGEAEFEEAILLNLRIGEKLIFSDVSFTDAFAGLIQLIFSLNLEFPEDADDFCQFLQRILCNFGNIEGARNKKNAVKKNYRDFEVCSCEDHFHHLNIFFQGFAAQVLLESNQGELMAIFT